jgi:Mannosyl-glycoprotein endo-beta-N-acetylglucosaminidase
MTPADFAAAYRDTAEKVSRGTGIDPMVLLAQWANETAWGTVVVGNNLGNIRCSPTTFCSYATLDAFAQACIATFHNGYYDAVLAATTAEAQLAAIVASPWSSAHYGGDLHPFYDPLEAYEMTPAESNTLSQVYYLLTTGIDSYPGSAGTRPIITKAETDAILAAVKAAPPPTVNFQPVLDAIAQVQAGLTALQAAVTAIKAKTDKDLA